MNTHPTLTVVMPVYNGEKYLAEAIDSVLHQSYIDFELLIINDCSTDGSEAIIKSYTDQRIRLINNPQNKGIPYNRNLGLNEARGEFLCWTDCDDLNVLDRFEKQVRFLQQNTDYGACGTKLCRFKDASSCQEGEALASWQEIQASLLFKAAAIPNATAMLRMSEIRKNQLQYNTSLPIGEDYDFILRCSHHFKLTNLQEVLYKYRDSETSIMKSFDDQDQKKFLIKKTIYPKALLPLGIDPTEDDLRAHEDSCSVRIFDSFAEFKTCYQWLSTINAANNDKKIYDNEVFSKVMGNQFFFVAKKASKFGLKTFIFFIKNASKQKWNFTFANLMKLAVRCALKHDKFEFKY
ncbi:MAG: glycosyltransferase family 2 protein [Flavobacteriaceae bacterium]